MAYSKPSKAKKAALMAMAAALYAVFFFISWSIAMPNFTLLYLPIVLLGVFPFWFGWVGLAGAMIGGYIGGVFVEGLPLHFALAEVAVAVMIFGLNWLLVPKWAAQAKSKKGILTLSAIYAATLFIGTVYILWQLAFFGMFPYSVAEAFLLPTYALNLPIVLIACPALIRAISPRLQTWGIYVGNFWQRNKPYKT